MLYLKNKINQLTSWVPITLLSLSGGALYSQTDNCDADQAVHSFMQSQITSGEIGYFLQKVNGPVLMEHNLDFRFEPASMIKILLHFHAMKEVQDNPDVALDQLYPWVLNLNNDKVNAAPEFSIGSTDYCTINPENQLATLEDILEGMMQVSDNRLTQAVRDNFGDANIIQTRNNLGMNTPELNHAMGCFCGHENDFNGQYRNHTTLRDMNKLYNSIANNTVLDVVNTATFKRIMDNMDNDSRLRNAINDVIDEENAKLTSPLSSSELTNFKDQVEAIRKGGYYQCDFDATDGNDTFWRTGGGLAKLPFKTSSTNVSLQEYIVSAFYHEADQVPGGAITYAEILRNEIYNALESWSANQININEATNYIGPYVDAFTATGYLDDAVDVVNLYSGRFLTTHRNQYGYMTMYIWDFNSTTNALSYVNGYVSYHATDVKTVVLSHDKIVQAIRMSSGQLRVVAWNIALDGQITFGDYAEGSNVEEVEIVEIGGDRVATAVKNASGDLEISTWDISPLAVTAEQTLTLGAIHELSAARISDSKMLVATQEVINSSLALRQISFFPGLAPSLLSEHITDQAVTRVDLTRLSQDRYATHTATAYNLTTTTWDICGLDILEIGQANSYATWDVSGVAFEDGQMVTASRYHTHNTLLFDGFASGTGGSPVVNGQRTDYPIGQVELCALDISGKKYFVSLSTDYYSRMNIKVMSATTPSSGGTGPPAPAPMQSETAVDTPSFELKSAYPNPFSGTTTIPFTLEKESQVQLRIFDMMGKEVYHVPTTSLSQGEHSIIWDASEQTSGIYYCQLIVNGEQKQSQLVLTK